MSDQLLLFSEPQSDRPSHDAGGPPVRVDLAPVTSIQIAATPASAEASVASAGATGNGDDPKSAPAAAGATGNGVSAGRLHPAADAEDGAAAPVAETVESISQTSGETAPGREGGADTGNAIDEQPAAATGEVDLASCRPKPKSGAERTAKSKAAREEMGWLRCELYIVRTLAEELNRAAGGAKLSRGELIWRYLCGVPEVRGLLPDGCGPESYPTKAKDPAGI